MNADKPIIEIKDLKIRLGGQWIHNGLNLNVNRGEILGIVGSSGSGKSTLIREILMLSPPHSGSIRVFGQELTTASSEALLAVQRRWGVLFQQNALFSSLTLLENVKFPLLEREQNLLDDATIQDLALQKISAVGLPIEAINKYPSELSGGMEKRAALARAMIRDPELIFLDEPTTGLDPDSAAELDELIVTLQSAMELTIVLVTHDLDTLWRVTNRIAFLYEGKVLCVDNIENLVKNPHPAIQHFFNGPRGRMAGQHYG